MLISHWPDHKIMELPDNLFGRRWLYSLHGFSGSQDRTEWRFLGTLPERVVIWELCARAKYKQDAAGDADARFKLVLVDDANASDADINNGEPVFGYCWEEDTGERTIAFDLEVRRLRMLVHTQGKRFAITAIGAAADNAEFEIGIVVSSVPVSIPDGIGKLYE